MRFYVAFILIIPSDENSTCDTTKITLYKNYKRLNFSFGFRLRKLYLKALIRIYQPSKKKKWVLGAQIITDIFFACYAKKINTQTILNRKKITIAINDKALTFSLMCQKKVDGILSFCLAINKSHMIKIQEITIFMNLFLTIKRRSLTKDVKVKLALRANINTCNIKYFTIIFFYYHQ